MSALLHQDGMKSQFIRAIFMPFPGLSYLRLQALSIQAMPLRITVLYQRDDKEFSGRAKAADGGAGQGLWKWW